jgi:tetratricopeptide (TPR) repeat protein
MSKQIIFVSAVSEELKSARQLVANTLTSLGYEPDWQDIPSVEQSDMRRMLQRRIDASEGVVQIIGQRYGAEPPGPDERFGRVSYTQYEALYARQRGKRVWHLLLDDGFPTDPCEAEAEASAQLQQDYRRRVAADSNLYHSLTNREGVENCVLKLRSELDRLRRRGKQWAVAFLVCLLALGGGVVWLNRGQQHSERVAGDTQRSVAQADQKVTTVLQRYKEMEQVLVRLADVEMHAKQLGEALTPEQLRLRAYAILENELGLASGTLAKELPSFALEIYQRTDTALLMKARAAYALGKYEEAEKLFLQSDTQDKQPLESAQRVTEKLRKQRIDALTGAGQAAMAQIQYARALEHHRAAAALSSAQGAPMEWAGLQWNMAFVLELMGNSREAEEVYRRVLEVYVREIGEEDQRTLTVRNNLANSMLMLGKRAEAEREHRAVLAIRIRTLGAEHPETLTSGMNLANALNAQGKCAEAEQLHRAVIAVRERTLGPDDPSTLASRNNLASTLLYEGKYAEAEKEQREVIAIKARVLGPEHPNTLKSRTNLVSALLGQGKFSEADEEGRIVIPIMERVLGPEHPDTLTSGMIFSRVMVAQDRLTDAARMQLVILQIMDRVLGPEHPQTVQGRNLAADTLLDGRMYEAAEKELRKILALQMKTLSPEDDAVLSTRNKLANALFGQDKYAEAEPEHRAVLEIRTRLFGAEDPDTMISRNNLAQLLHFQGKDDEAAEEHRQLIAMRERLLGPEHPHTVLSRRNLAGVYRAQKKYAEAEREYRKLVDLQKNVSGRRLTEGYEDTYYLSLVLVAQKRYPEALDFMKRAEEGWKELFGENHQNSREAMRQRIEIEGMMQKP